MKNRIREVRNNADRNQEQFANRIGLTKNFISLIETGSRVPSDRTINDICREFNINEEWLRNGNGEMFKKRTRTQEIGFFVNEIMDAPDENFKKRFVAALSKLDEKDWEAIAVIVDKLSKEG